MQPPKVISTAIIVATLTLLAFLFCQVPPDPFDASKAVISLFLTSSNGTKSNSEITDTVGNKVIVTLNVDLAQHFDSTVISITNGTVETHHIKFTEKEDLFESIDYPVTFSSAGNYLVSATGYIPGYPNREARALIAIEVRQGLPPANQPPVWSATTLKRTARAGSKTTLDLKELCSDPNGDAITFTLLSSLPDGDTIIGTTWSYTPASGLPGSHLVKIVASDPSGATDTVTIDLTVSSETADVTPPAKKRITPVLDSQTVSSASVQITVSFSDESGVDTVVCSMGTQTYAVTRTADTLYSATVTGLATGLNTIRFIAKDAAPTANTCTLYVSVKYTPPASDNLPPTITKVTPANDSVATNSANYTVTLSCTDPSGVKSVNGIAGTTVFTGVRSSGSNWDIPVSGLAEGSYTQVVFTATDSSLSANSAPLTLFIKYDPTMGDMDGPTIRLISGPPSGSVVSDPLITIIDSITDPSGVESVSWSINAGVAQPMTPVPGKPGQYSLTAGMSTVGEYTILVTAVDKSTIKSSKSQTILLTYVTPPSIDIEPKGGGICSGNSTTLKVTASGTPPLSYQWYDAKGAITGATASLYSFVPVENRTITCVVSNKATVSDTSVPCTITLLPAVKVTVTPENAQSCNGEIATFTAAATGGSDFTYEWYAGDGTTNTLLHGFTTNTLTLNATDAVGPYYCTARSSQGCSAASNVVTFTINEEITLKITATNSALCAGSSVNLTATPTGGSGHTFQWYNGATAVGTKSSVYAATAAGTYTCEATSSAGCKGTAKFEVTENVASTKPSIRLKSGSTTPVCPGGSVVIEIIPGSGTLGTGATWKWFNNGSATPVANDGLTSFTGYPQGATEYTVQAIGGPCGDGPESDPVTVTLKTLPTAPVGVATPPAICVGAGQVTLSISSGTLGTGGSWKWYESNKTTPVTVTTFNPSATKTYYVRSEGGCEPGAWSGPVEVTVNQPATTPTGSASPATVCLGNGQKVTLTVTSGTVGTGGSWKWYESNKTTPVTVNPFTPSTSKTYYVRSENAACGNSLWSGPVQVTVNTPSLDHADGSPTINVCIDDAITVTGSCAVSYEWWFDPFGTGNYSLIPSTSMDLPGQGTATLRSNTPAGSFVYCKVTFANNSTAKTGVWSWGSIYCP